MDWRQPLWTRVISTSFFEIRRRITEYAGHEGYLFQTHSQSKCADCLYSESQKMLWEALYGLPLQCLPWAIVRLHHPSYICVHGRSSAQTGIQEVQNWGQLGIIRSRTQSTRRFQYKSPEAISQINPFMRGVFQNKCVEVNFESFFNILGYVFRFIWKIWISPLKWASILISASKLTSTHLLWN